MTHLWYVLRRLRNGLETASRERLGEPPRHLQVVLLRDRPVEAGLGTALRVEQLLHGGGLKLSFALYGGKRHSKFKHRYYNRYTKHTTPVNCTRTPIAPYIGGQCKYNERCTTNTIAPYMQCRRHAGTM